MSSSPNWSKLVEQGRAKAHGIPWTEIELKAIYELKIPADYVRNGCLTVEQFESEKKEVKTSVEETGQKPLMHCTKLELIEIAQNLRLPNITGDVKRLELIALLRAAQAKFDVKLPSGGEVISESLTS